MKIINFLYLFYQNIITDFNDIIFVWSNDAHKLSVFVFVIYFPFFIALFLPVFINGIKLRLNSKNIFSIIYSIRIEIIFTFTFIVCVLGGVGFGNLILPPLADAILRSIGLVMYITVPILLFLFNQLRIKKNVKNDVFDNDFFSLVRYPIFSFLFFICLGISLLTLTIYGLIFDIIILLPLIIITIKKEEDQKILDNPNYMDYQKDVPMIIPSFIVFIKKYIIQQKIDE